MKRAGSPSAKRPKVDLVEEAKQYALELLGDPPVGLMWGEEVQRMMADFVIEPLVGCVAREDGRHVLVPRKGLMRNILIDGCPGVGKTMLIRAAYHEARRRLSGRGLQLAVYALVPGTPAETVFAVFQDAAHNAPGLIIIDEVAHLTESRTAHGALLSLTHDPEDCTARLVLAATHRLMDVEPALQDRFATPWRIRVGEPTPERRRVMLDFLVAHSSDPSVGHCLTLRADRAVPALGTPAGCSFAEFLAGMATDGWPGLLPRDLQKLVASAVEIARLQGEAGTVTVAGHFAGHLDEILGQNSVFCEDWPEWLEEGLEDWLVEGPKPPVPPAAIPEGPRQPGPLPALQYRHQHWEGSQEDAFWSPLRLTGPVPVCLAMQYAHLRWIDDADHPCLHCPASGRRIYHEPSDRTLLRSLVHAQEQGLLDWVVHVRPTARCVGQLEAWVCAHFNPQIDPLHVPSRQQFAILDDVMASLMEHEGPTTGPALSSHTPTGPAQPPAPLFPYQWEGVQWMSQREHEAGGGLLSDEMGLGKTLQMLKLVQLQVEGAESRPAPTLVVCPTSVVCQWQEDAGWLGVSVSRHTKAHQSINVSKVYGELKGLCTKMRGYEAKRRKPVRRQLANSTEMSSLQHMYLVKKKKLDVHFAACRRSWDSDVVLTDYESVLMEYRILQDFAAFGLTPPLMEIEWGRVILDEPHQLQSTGLLEHKWSTQRGRAVLQLKTSKRWCVTATFEARGKQDLFSLVTFLQRGYAPALNLWYKLMKSVAKDRHSAGAELFSKPAFQAKLSKMQLCRTLDQVPDIPVMHWSVQLLTPLRHERILYTTLHNAVCEFLETDAAVPWVIKELLPMLENLLTCPFSFLRRLYGTKDPHWRKFRACVDRLESARPVASLGSHRLNVVTGRLLDQCWKPVGGQEYCWFPMVSLAMYSQKLKVLEERLLACHQNKERALVYFGSEMCMMQTVYYLRSRGTVRFGYLSRCVGKARGDLHGDALLKAFSDPSSEYTALLMNLTRTSAGLNLSVANHVIFFDTCGLDSGSIRQAVGRVRRIGQKNPQHVTFIAYKLALDELELGLHSQAFPTSERIHLPVSIQRQLSADPERCPYSLPAAWVKCDTLKVEALRQRMAPCPGDTHPADITPFDVGTQKHVFVECLLDEDIYWLK